MTSSWIPGPVAVVWVALFALVAIVHVAHLMVLSGRHRLWHTGHLLMAAGMMVMFWPGGMRLLPAGVGVGIYALAAAALAVGLLLARLLRRMRLGPLWLASLVDLAAMGYMFAMMTTRLAWLSALGAAWFAVQMLGWAGGRLGRVLERGGLGEVAPPTHAVPSPPVRRTLEPTAVPDPAGESGPARSTGTVTTAAPRMARAVGGPVVSRVVDGGRRDWSVRITLTIMSAGMTYMLLAVQFGTPAMNALPNMPGM